MDTGKVTAATESQSHRRRRAVESVSKEQASVQYFLPFMPSSRRTTRESSARLEWGGGGVACLECFVAGSSGTKKSC